MSCLHARWIVLVASAFCSFTAGIAAGDDGPPQTTDPLESVARIERALAQPAHLEFVETPLRDVAAYVADTFQVPVYLDARGLEDAGVTVEQPVTSNLKGIKLESALNLLLRPLELDFTIADEVLLISTQEHINNSLEIRVYPVAGLIGDNQPPEGADKQGQYGGGVKTSDLVELIQVIIEPESCGTVGGPAAIHDSLATGTVVCSQTRRAHQKIARLLSELRDGTSQPHAVVGP